ncbi:MAG: response regulator [Thermoplasmata archaeon]|nr:response regulator [Candidatus Sysuiplasma jiujiangense]
MMKVLVVDDSSLTRAAMVAALTAYNYEIVAEGQDGDDAVRLYKDRKPDVILIDLAMPNKDGLEAIKEILEFDPQAKIVAISALYDRSMQKRAIELGAASYIVKPFELTELISVMGKFEKQ